MLSAQNDYRKTLVYEKYVIRWTGSGAGQGAITFNVALCNVIKWFFFRRMKTKATFKKEYTNKDFENKSYSEVSGSNPLLGKKARKLLKSIAIDDNATSTKKSKKGSRKRLYKFLDDHLG